MSTTESDASEIEEEIVEFPDSTESQQVNTTIPSLYRSDTNDALFQFPNQSNNHRQSNNLASKSNKKNAKSKDRLKPSVIPTYDDNDR